MTFPFAALPENLAAFCAMLRRDYGYRVGPRELQDAVRAIAVVNLSDEAAVRDAVRPVLAGRREEARIFDQAFDRFFHSSRLSPPARATLAAAPAERGSPRSPDVRAPGDSADAPEDAREEPRGGAPDRQTVRAIADQDAATAAALLRASYSPFEAEGPAPVLGPVERDWRDAAALLVSRVRAGLSRRWRPALRGQRFDLRRTLRTSLHTGGEVVSPRYRVRPRRQPRFVLLIDGSRSMGEQARPALQMAVALSSVTPNVETFTFSTSLRRVTRDVRRAAAGERRRLQLHHAWGGGTTIGACLRQFVRRYGERLLGRDTVVIVASDGLDVGEPAVLRDALARLSRHSAAVIWLNPLLETPGYAPTAAGMSAARPFVTTLAAVNAPAGLARLARSLRIR